MPAGQVSFEALGCFHRSTGFYERPQAMRNIVHNTVVYSRKRENPSN